MSKQTQTAQTNTKTLIVIRHAHRDTNHGHRTDNGLSAKGYDQAKSIVIFFKQNYSSQQNFALLSSPKKRCQETLEPLANELNLEIDVREILSEGAMLEKRAISFAHWWQKQGPEFCVLCSHGDWIPEFTKELIGQPIDLQKSGLIEIQMTENCSPTIVKFKHSF